MRCASGGDSNDKSAAQRQSRPARPADRETENASAGDIGIDGLWHGPCVLLLRPQELRVNAPFLPPDVAGLVAALAIGLLIGLERGWHDREIPDGGRVAGLRTFALTGLLGGVLGHLQPDFGPWPLLGALAGISLLLAVFYAQSAKMSGNLSATTPIALLLTLLLGVFAAHRDITMALAMSVIVAVLLSMKPTLHGWLHLIEYRELTASLQLLVLSIVILPYLPNSGMGPYAALNPYQLWWAVILIAFLSLAGHLVMRITGAQRGILWTGLLGGLASSTAITVALARYARQQPQLTEAVVASALAACGVMFFRMTFLLVVIQPALASWFVAVLLVTGAVLLVLAFQHWHSASATNGSDAIEAMPPFDLMTALIFAGFLPVTGVLVPAAQQWLGNSGIYVVSALSGLADVDAIVISLARSYSDQGLSAATVLIALALATSANMLTKVSIAWTTAGHRVGQSIGGGYAIALLFGAMASALVIFLK